MASASTYVYLLMLWTFCSKFAAHPSERDVHPRLRHVVSSLQEQVAALQKAQQHNRMVIEALEMKLDDELSNRNKLLQDRPMSVFEEMAQMEHRSQKLYRDPPRNVLEMPSVDEGLSKATEISVPSPLHPTELSSMFTKTLDPDTVVEEDLKLVSNIDHELEKLRLDVDSSARSPPDANAKEFFRSELDFLRSELQKMRQDIESQKSKYEEQEVQLTEMKSGRITTKWLQKTVGDIRREVSELAAALNISVAIRESQQLEVMLDRVRGDVSTLRSELDHESAGLAKHAAIVDEMKSELQEVRAMTTTISSDYQQLVDEVTALKEEIFSTERTTQTKNARLWDEGIPVEGSGTEDGSGSIFVQPKGTSPRRHSNHHLIQEIQSVKASVQKLQQTHSLLSKDISFLKHNHSSAQSKIDKLQLALDHLDNRTTSAYEDQCVLSKTVHDVRHRLSIAEERTIKNGQNIVNITEAMTGMDKVHSSTVQLFEALESLEDEFSRNVGDLQKEISKFEFNVAQVQGSFDILRHDQSSHHEDLRGLKMELAKLNQDFRRDNYRLTTIHNEMLNHSLQRCAHDSKDTFQDLKLANLELQLSKLAKREEDAKHQANMMYSKLTQKVDRSALQSVEMSFKDIMEDVRNVSSHFANLTSMQLRLKHEVMKFVRQLPYDCSMSGVPNPAKDYLNGVYLIHLEHTHHAKEVYCDMESTANRRWTIIQRRNDGVVDFFRSWDDYKQGFGSPNGEYWLGNEALHLLTTTRNYTLRIDMWDVFDRYMYADYAYFRVSSEEGQYRLDIGEYSGNASDALRHHQNMAFSTHDRDNDVSSTHCAMYYSAGWWYQHCQYVNVNGRYSIGMTWYDEANRDWVHLTRVEMKIAEVVT